MHMRRNRFVVPSSTSRVNWVIFLDFVEVLQGAKNSFDVTIYLPDLSGSILASFPSRGYLKHHQMSNLKPGL